MTLAPLPGLAAADAVVLCRSAIRQLCPRAGYHATFMSRPVGADTASAGWQRPRWDGRAIRAGCA